MVDHEVVKSISIKLDTTIEQEQELTRLFEAFRIGINWSLKEIENRYQSFLQNYKELPEDQRIEGICADCNKKARLFYQDKAGKKVCMTCARKCYSEYTVRKEVYGARGRTVESDLKDIIELPNKTHYDSLFSQAYAMWKSYRAWCDKRQREKAYIEEDLDTFSNELRHAADEIERYAKHIKDGNSKLTWLQAKAQAFKNIYSNHPGISEEDIVKVHNRLMDYRRASRPIHFPELKECRTVKMNANFVNWNQEKLYMILFHKSRQEFKYFGNVPKFLFSWNKVPGEHNNLLKKYLMHKYPWVRDPASQIDILKVQDEKRIRIINGDDLLLLSLDENSGKIILDAPDTIFGHVDRDKVIFHHDAEINILVKHENSELNVYRPGYLSRFIPQMEQDNKAYCNLTKNQNSYYLIYPLTIKVKQPPDIKECDTFVYMSSPTKTAIIGYDGDGAMQSVRWFGTGKLAFAKRHSKEKRAEIVSRKYSKEKMRNIRRRKKKIVKRGAVEARFVSTFNHQLTREMIDYVIEQSENPKLLIWDIGNGITQNFGRTLNYLKNLWPAVQQQEYLKHKAMQMGVPVVEIKYNECNDLVCSSCEAKQLQDNGTLKKKNPAKVITQIIKGINNFKCQKCGYEVNMLINQANNIAGL